MPCIVIRAIATIISLRIEMRYTPRDRPLPMPWQRPLSWSPPMALMSAIEFYGGQAIFPRCILPRSHVCALRTSFKR